MEQEATKAPLIKFVSLIVLQVLGQGLPSRPVDVEESSPNRTILRELRPPSQTGLPPLPPSLDRGGIPPLSSSAGNFRDQQVEMRCEEGLLIRMAFHKFWFQFLGGRLVEQLTLKDDPTYVITWSKWPSNTEYVSVYCRGLPCKASSSLDPEPTTFFFFLLLLSNVPAGRDERDARNQEYSGPGE